MENIKTTNNAKTTTVAENRYVIGPGGVRMTYKEWREYIESTKN